MEGDGPQVDEDQREDLRVIENVAYGQTLTISCEQIRKMNERFEVPMEFVPPLWYSQIDSSKLAAGESLSVSSEEVRHKNGHVDLGTGIRDYGYRKMTWERTVVGKSEPWDLKSYAVLWSCIILLIAILVAAWLYVSPHRYRKN